MDFKVNYLQFAVSSVSSRLQASPQGVAREGRLPGQKPCAIGIGGVSTRRRFGRYGAAEPEGSEWEC